MIKLRERKEMERSRTYKTKADTGSSYDNLSNYSVNNSGNILCNIQKSMLLLDQILIVYKQLIL